MHANKAWPFGAALLRAGGAAHPNRQSGLAMRMADASDAPTSDAEWPPEFHKKFRAGTDWPTGG